MRPKLEVADIFRRNGDAFRAAKGNRLSQRQRRVMSAIEACRTPALGGHVERCQDCGVTRIAFNSCRDRPCPKCQGLARLRWLADRRTELLPVPYFHVVFTVPAPVAAIGLQNKAIVYDILFKAAAQTIRAIAADRKHLGAETGMIAILHTWGQTLTHHPHVHCIVPGGGLGPAGRWVGCKPNFFLPVHVLSRLYRRLFLERLQTAFDAGGLSFHGELARLQDPAEFAGYLKPLTNIPWVVFAKPPFANPSQILDYLGRYTHRVAIANGRLLDCQEGRVGFRWKDYRTQNKSKAMALDADEFMRRSAQLSPFPIPSRASNPKIIANAARCSPASASTFARVAAVAWSTCIHLNLPHLQVQSHDVTALDARLAKQLHASNPCRRSCNPTLPVGKLAPG